jgi:splicing factor 3A subunit 1
VQDRHFGDGLQLQSTFVEMDTVKAAQGKVTGVIIPPPEIRAVVDKTAAFVAKIGKSFEQRILSSAEGQTAKFNFMKPFDPYHAYYEMKIKEGEDAIANGGTEESKVDKPLETRSQQEEVQPEATAKPTVAPAAVTTAVKASILNPIAQLAQTKPTEAPPALEFCVAQGQPAGLTPLDVDIIKLAAQFTAINGREFLANLALREQRNPQYDFLKPTHMLFSYFTYLVDCYAKIAHPSSTLLQQVEARCDWHSAMEGAVRRWQWTRAEEERKRAESGEADGERLAFQAIDWYDFAVVETIDFPEDELLELPALSGIDLGSNNGSNSAGSGTAGAPPPPPPNAVPRPGLPPPPPPRAPTSTSSSNSNSAAQGRPAPSSSYYAPSGAAGGAGGAMDVDQDEAQEQTAAVEEDNDEDLSDLKVVTDYTPALGGSVHPGASTAGSGNSAGLMMVDPISGKAVPVDQLSEHMRVQLLDPRWRQQQQRFVDKQKETGFAEGGSIADSLKNFARKRGDIFGQAATGAGADSALAIAEQEALERRKAEVRGDY